MRWFQRAGESKLRRRRKRQHQGMVRNWSTFPETDGSLGKMILQMYGSGVGPLFSYGFFSQAVSALNGRSKEKGREVGGFVVIKATSISLWIKKFRLTSLLLPYWWLREYSYCSLG